MTLLHDPNPTAWYYSAWEVASTSDTMQSDTYQWRLSTDREISHHTLFARNQNYSKISNIRCTKSPNLNVSRLIVQLSLPNPMTPGVKSRMKM